MNEVEERIFDVDCRVLLQIVLVCTNRALKMKDHLPLCKEFTTLCSENRVAVGLVV